MIKGTVTFRADFPMIEFDQFAVVSSEFPGVSTCRMVSNATEGVRLDVECDQVASIADALDAARSTAEHVARVLSFATTAYFPPFRLESHDLSEMEDSRAEKRQLIHSLAEFVTATEMVSVIKKVGPECVPEIKKLLETTSASGSHLFAHLHVALGLSDPIAKFMALYNIVLSQCNDRQEDVDKFVLSVNKQTPTNRPFKARKSGVQETIFTRLRNEVGHTRPNSTTLTTRKEMEANLPGLIEVVKAIMSK